MAKGKENINHDILLEQDSWRRQTPPGNRTTTTKKITRHKKEAKYCTNFV